jgi:hypothetical protein
MSGTSPSENRIVKLINEYLSATEQPGLAYRLKQSRFYTQYIDVLVDSRNPDHYLAIEVKSINPTKTSKFYFSSWKRSKGKHQITTITEFIEDTGRFGILAAEIKQGRGPKQNEFYLLPWSHVCGAFLEGEVAIDPKDLPGKYPQLKKDANGLLNLEKCLSDLR